ncbi:MAG: hypothetical protein H5U02_00495 [Clostridia bacterium]|nr:hypothetical protein [Clostridia bacterium]
MSKKAGPVRVVWFSRHDPLERQIAELRRLFGEDVQVVRDPEPFDSAEDVVRRFRAAGGDEMVVVAPLSVLGRLCDLGLRPLWAEMEVVGPEEAEVVVSGRHYRFARFRRVKRLALEFEDV